MKVEVEVEEVEVLNERGGTTPGVEVTCGRCDKKVKCFGRGEKSIIRGLMMLKEDCDEGEKNYYVHQS